MRGQGEADDDDVEILLLFAQAHETLVKHSGNALGFPAGNSCMYEVAPQTGWKWEGGGGEVG